MFSQLSGNFRTINVVSRGSEFLEQERPYIRKNVIKGRFNSIDDYLDIHFKLLREDFIGPIRTEVLEYFKGLLNAKDCSNITVYKKLKLIYTAHNRHGLCYKLKFPDDNFQVDDETFKFGSLLLFAARKGEVSFTGLVIDTENDSVIVGFDHYKEIPQIQNREYLMILCNTFFAPYHYTLNVLQTLNSANFPMEKYIIKLDHRISCPKYFHSGCSLMLTGNKETVRLNPFGYLNQWPDRHFFGFNQAQYKAFLTAIMHEFVTIQGPPGTGKTFLAKKIATCLLQNRDLWHRQGPMLIISFTNHALDQFLEGLTHVTHRLIRMGGRSESTKLKEFTYDEYKKTHQITIPRIYTASREENRKREMLMVMRTAKVIGMTTTFAARWHDVLESLGCPIIIVEEAAEILEAHVIASLNKNCQHLLLFGDHQQLQPHNSDYKLKTNYNICTSLFERMVQNDMECSKLNVQYRMRPEISSLIRPAIYKDYIDDDSVLKLPPIRGVSKSLYFISHTKEDSETKTSSRTNRFEACFLIQLAKYLLSNEYSPSDVTILATYSGQVALLKSLQQNDKDLKDVRISTVDNYQGEESKIILLSLVKSNCHKSPGFMKEDNRICVALSRAKEGMYIIGNIQLFESTSQTWKAISEVLKQQTSIGPYITLKCQIHGHFTQIKNLEDFNKVSNGGCNNICMYILSCGHKCTLKCHGSDINHKNYQCKQICGRKLCENGHGTCKKKCSEPCDKCELYLLKMLSCGHSLQYKCGTCSPQICSQRVILTADCGHIFEEFCFRRNERFVCSKLVTVNAECGHKLEVQCSKRNDICYFECSRRVTVTAECGHIFEVSCPKRNDIRYIVCSRRVTVTAECGHLFEVPCFKRNDAWYLRTHVCYQQVIVPVECGHIFEVPCFKRSDVRCSSRWCWFKKSARSVLCSCTIL